jgi:hypothetical protein
LNRCDRSVPVPGVKSDPVSGLHRNQAVPIELEFVGPKVPSGICSTGRHSIGSMKRATLPSVTNPIAPIASSNEKSGLRGRLVLLGVQAVMDGTGKRHA